MSSALLDAIVGWCFCLLGLGSWRRRRPEPGLLMVATGVLWFVGGSVGVAVFAHRGPLIHLLVGYPRGRLRDRSERAAVAVGYLDALVYPVGRSSLATVALAGLVGAVMMRGHRRSRGAERRARLTSLVASVAVFGVLCAGAAARLTGSRVGHQVLLAYQLTLIAVSVLLFADLRWGRWSRAAITGLAVDLGQTGPAGALRDQLAAALGDPSVVLAYRDPHSDRMIDETGQPVDIESDLPGRTITPIHDAGRKIAVLMHDTAVLDDPLLLDSVTALAKIALANVRLHAEVQDRVAEVEASRRRLVTVADAERARLEAELRSGTQSRLDRVASLLADMPDGGDELATQLAASRDAIREFARGVHPRVLTECGLAVAIAELASTAPVPVAVTAPDGRFPSDIEAAAYFVCAEALTNIAKYAGATQARIRLTPESDALIVEVSDDGIGGAERSKGSGLTGLADRLDVLGGILTVTSPPDHGTLIVARIPLVSR